MIDGEQVFSYIPTPFIFLRHLPTKEQQPFGQRASHRYTTEHRMLQQNLDRHNSLQSN